MKTTASIYTELEKSVCESLTWLWSRKTGHGEITGEKIQGRREVLGLSTEVPQHLKRDQALSLWSRGTDSKTLDYWRTNLREYQIVRTHTKETTWITQHHPTTSSTLCKMPHLNKKQNKNTNPITSRQDYHLTQPCPSEEKQTNKTVQISPYKKLTKTTVPTLGGQKLKGRKNSTLKPQKRRLQTQ